MTVGRFEGKSIIVSGAGSGIGRRRPCVWPGKGASVLAVDINDDGLREVAALVHDPSLATLVADVADRTAPARIMEMALDSHGSIDHLVNNAGIGGRGGGAAGTSDADWDAVMDVNIASVFRMSRAALAHLPRPGGRLVQISSVFGLVGFPGSAAYAAAKGAVAQLTRQMAADYCRRRDQHQRRRTRRHRYGDDGPHHPQ